MKAPNQVLLLVREAGLLAGATAWLVACASTPTTLHYDLFAPLAQDDAFAPAIDHWQAETRLEDLASEIAELRKRIQQVPPAEVPTPLAAAYRDFRGELRRRVVQDTVGWVQTQSGLYYRRDSAGDDWPVLGELLKAGADDCDGMDLLTFSLLRGLGFQRGEIYRAIIRNRRTDLHHIVTLWFEAGQRGDPWLLDSTGEVSRAVLRLSEHPDWQPLRLFDETSAFAAQKR